MDQLDHDIVQDLLPLYHDGVCSDKSRAAVEEHLQTCEACRAALTAMDAPLPEVEKAADDAAVAVQKISGEWKRGKRRAHIIGVIVAVVVCAAAAVGIWTLTTWTCIPMDGGGLYAGCLPAEERRRGGPLGFSGGPGDLVCP